MKGLRLSIMLLTAVFVFVAVLTGCQSKEATRFSGYKEIAELATETCYYHNVAEIRNDGTDILLGLVNVGYIKAWFEYRGAVDLGIDVSRVRVEGPDWEGNVTIVIPPVQVIGTPKVDETSFSDVYVDKGMLTSLSPDMQTEAYKRAQDEMKTQAENDQALLFRAQERVKTLLGQYVKNVGEAQGKTYKVNFIDAK